ncbi:MAG TPA: class I SAM-dependent methyltransferase [Magnetococcales bacterium]|nr:class I SAM-dependent methyltransferase [Magnetococcales bacterium]
MQPVPQKHSLHPACYLCGATNIKKKFKVNDHHIVQCRTCSFVFVWEHWSPDALATYYKQQGTDQVYGEVENRVNLNYYYESLRDIIQAMKPGGQLLDVGCSEGQFLDVMHGWQCHGVELEPVAAQKAQIKYGDRVFNGNLEDAGFSNETFDVITLQDVLDHMPAPLASLRKCRDLLKPGGLIVVKVHNISCLYARITGSKYYAIVPPVHLSYFNKKTLDFALVESGFSVLSHKYISHILFLKTIFFRLSEGKQRGLFYHCFKLVEHSRLGKIRIRKNLHDIITTWAVKL